MQRWAVSILTMMLACTMHAEAAQPTAQATRKPAPEQPKSFWQVVENFLQMTFTNIGALGEGRIEPGQVMEAEIEGNRLAGPARPVSADKDLAWPVAGPNGSIYALRGRQLVRIERPGAAPTPHGAPADWVKLIGVAPDGRVLGFVQAPPLHRPAIVDARGRLSLGEPPASREQELRQGVLLQQSRAFADGTRLRLVRSPRGGRGMDVVLEKPGVTIRTSDCGNADCGQPSLSPDGRRVLFVR